MSDEGRNLRNRQQENVRRLRLKLIQAGLPVIHSPSHIIPIHVSSESLMNFIFVSFSFRLEMQRLQIFFVNNC